VPVADHEIAFRGEKRRDGGGRMLAVRIERQDRVGDCRGSIDSRGEGMALPAVRGKANQLDVGPRRHELGQTRGSPARHAVIDNCDSCDVRPERVEQLVRGGRAVTWNNGNGRTVRCEAHVAGRPLSDAARRTVRTVTTQLSAPEASPETTSVAACPDANHEDCGGDMQPVSPHRVEGKRLHPP
jgi:hypothetical protein